jgi:hypothetical protein
MYSVEKRLAQYDAYSVESSSILRALALVGSYLSSAVRRIRSKRRGNWLGVR